VTHIFLKLRSINLMAPTPWVGSPKWRIISFGMALPMSWPKLFMLFSIWILNVGNGVNEIKIHARGIFHGPSLLQISMNALTLTPTI
jgi:hypothetical protein